MTCFKDNESHWAMSAQKIDDSWALNNNDGDKDNDNDNDGWEALGYFQVALWVTLFQTSGTRKWIVPW